MIKLGSKVKCKITGLVGVVVARIEFINGCVQYEVQAAIGKDNKIPEAEGIDEGSLEIIKSKKKVIKKSTTGGPNSSSRTMKGY